MKLINLQLSIVVILLAVILQFMSLQLKALKAPGSQTFYLSLNECVDGVSKGAVFRMGVEEDGEYIGIKDHAIEEK